MVSCVSSLEVLTGVTTGLIGMITALAALVMSIYNFWKARRGPKIILGPIVEIGTMIAFNPMTNKEHLLLYIPVQFFNEGTSTAVISDLEMTAVGPEGSVPVFLMKRVKGRASDEIETIRPAFPIFIASGEFLAPVFEFMDGPEKALELDQSYQVTLKANYSIKRSARQSYYLHLPRESTSKFPKLTWVHLEHQETDAPPPIVFGKDIGKM